MANQPESATYDAGVYQLELLDPVQGGVGGLSNKALLNLANRTAYLKQHMDLLEAGTTVIPGYALLNSPALTGSRTCPTPATGDNSSKIANRAFVQITANGYVSVNVAGGANVALTQSQYGVPIINLTGLITANIAVIFPTQSGIWIVSNNTTGAFSVTCRTSGGTGVTVAQGKSSGIYGDGTNIYKSRTDFTDAALLGSPTAPTPTAGDNSTLVATTAFVQTAVAGSGTGIAGSVKILVGTAAGGTKTASWTIKELVAETALGGTPYKGTNLALNFNGANTGAGGMDVAGTFPNLNDLHIYAIYNPGGNTWSTLGTTACNGPVYTGGHMPAGYTASAMISSGEAHVTPNIVPFGQVDNRIFLRSTNVLDNVIAARPSAWNALSISGAVPAIARTVCGNMGTGTNNSARIAVAADANGLGEFNNFNGQTTIQSPDGFFSVNPFSDIPLMTAQQIYWWTDSTSIPARINISNYTI